MFHDSLGLENTSTWVLVGKATASQSAAAVSAAALWRHLLADVQHDTLITAGTHNPLLTSPPCLCSVKSPLPWLPLCLSAASPAAGVSWTHPLSPLCPPRPPTEDSGMRNNAAAALTSTPPGSLPSQTHPCSPPDSASSLTPCSSLPPSVSPTLTDVFGLATPPMGSSSGGGYSLSSSCGGSGSSRSPSPLTLMQAASASGKAFASKPMEAWSKHDVADWLESLNLAEHRHAFLDNEIEGAHLPSLQKEDLIDLGVTRVGHRMNIERALKLLQDR